MIKAVVFDMDGTLLDSMHVWDHVGERYLERLGIKAKSYLEDALESMSLPQAAAYLKEEYDICKKTTCIQKEIESIVIDHYKNDVLLKPDVKQCLQHLRKKNINMCVLTSSSKEMATAALKRNAIYDYFDFIMTCEEAMMSKGDERIYEEILKRLNVEKEECIFVDDAFYAIQAMKRAGCIVYAVYDSSNQNDWAAICKLADQHFESLNTWEV